VFFQGLDWERMAAKAEIPPYQPKVAANADVRHFSNVFTTQTLDDYDSSSASNASSYLFQDFTYLYDEETM
jgi:hypothetical protein